MEKVSTFGKRLQQALDSAKMKPVELSEKTKIPKPTISQYLSGKYEAKQNRIELICDVLNVSESWLMGFDVPMKRSHDLPSNSIPIKHFAKIPVLGTIPAGVPLLAEENIEGYEFADVADPENYFYLRVKGDSMINARIQTNDLVLVRKQSFAENGQIIACRLNGDEATLKRFKKIGDRVLLMPENPRFEPIIISSNEFEIGFAEILGVVTEVKFVIEN